MNPKLKEMFIKIFVERAIKTRNEDLFESDEQKDEFYVLLDEFTINHFGYSIYTYQKEYSLDERVLNALDPVFKIVKQEMLEQSRQTAQN